MFVHLIGVEKARKTFDRKAKTLFILQAEKC